jgi:hypothetical protein
MSGEVDSLAGKIALEMRQSAKDFFDKWTPSERALVNLCTMDAAKLSIKAAAGQDITNEKAQIDAQLANIKVAGSESVSSTLWDVAAKILRLGAAVLLK